MSTPNVITRQQLQWALFLVCFSSFAIALVLAGIRFVGLIIEYNEFLNQNGIERCVKEMDESHVIQCHNFSETWGVNLYSGGWRVDLITRYTESVAIIYVPILSVMLTYILAANRRSVYVKVERDQYIIALVSFVFVHLLTLLVVAVAFLTSIPSSEFYVPNFLATMFSALMGTVVGFSFPEVTRPDGDGGRGI